MLNEQTVSVLVGFGVVVGLRLLDWAFPRGMVWKKVYEWSVQRQNENDNNDT